MESWEGYMKRLHNDIFDTFAYVADSMREAKDMKNKVDKMVDDLSKLPIKNDKNMKEKKKKKMTKAEAFEWLKGKKIKCYAGIANVYEEPNKVEKFLKDVGCRYHFVNHTSWRDWYWPLYGFMIDDKGDVYAAFENQMDFFKQNTYDEISVDDILSIEIVEEEKTMEAKALDEIAELGKRISGLLSVLGGGHVRITVDDVTLYGEGMNLFHSDPF